MELFFAESQVINNFFYYRTLH